MERRTGKKKRMKYERKNAERDSGCQEKENGEDMKKEVAVRQRRADDGMKK